VSTAAWRKLRDVLEEPEGGWDNAKVQPSRHLEVRLGVRKTTFRIRIQEDGKRHTENLPREYCDLRDWRRAQRFADQLISEWRHGKKPDSEKPDLRTAAVCDEIVANKAHLDKDTSQGAEIHYRLHIKPFLNGECPYTEGGLKPCPFPSYVEAGACLYARDMKPPVWINYKTHFRLHFPERSLFNHWKHFVTLGKYLFDKGVVRERLKFPFDKEKEDHRKKGMLIPDEDFKKMVAAANRIWRDRMILQRLTGQRPGLIRNLKKDRLDRQAGILRIRKEDSKNRRAYEFVVPGPALRILVERLPGESPYFFPGEGNPNQPMSKILEGWHGAIARAGVNPEYTPHDLRHTRLTELFKTPGINHALTCYQHDLSLEEAMRTYIHFEAQDTRVIAQDSERIASQLFPELP
jgi:hypothetical protein